ncbi:oligoendopeptidase F family protein, partial [Pseudomonas sp. 2822-15]|uniref:oligoendopeptidase F family protein n=1 Tax=Pseudomonas sp. 2822-15 TaxID=1712677 RepID=UPI00117B1455
ILTERLIPVATYANLKMAEDGTNPDSQTNYALMSAALTRINTATSFIESEVLALPEEQIKRYFEQQPDLKTYQIPLDDIL